MPTARNKFLTTARARFKQAQDADQKQRQRELDDLKFYAGEQWPEDVKAARAGQLQNNNLPPVPARPCLTINKTREPVRQVLNSERESDLGVELIPADDFGEASGPIDHTEIELREGLVRRIQRDSEAADARTWAFARAVIAGRGYYGVMTRYLPGRTSDQEVFVQRFYNQASVSLDPSHVQPDGSDADWGFIGSDVPKDQYDVEYAYRNGKKNQLADCSDDEWRALGDEQPDWFNTDGDTRSVRVVDYYYTVRTPRQLAMFPDGRAEWVDELPEGTDPKAYELREVVEKAIKWAKIDGCDDDVLDQTDWPGHYLPIIKVIGEELQPYDNERRCEGMVRPMLDPCRGNNYMISKWVEMVGLAPIPPWMMAAGQDEGFEAEYAASNTRTLPVLHFLQNDSDGRPAPPPFRVDARTDIAAVAGSVQMFNDAIVSTSGVSDTALGNIDPSVKSGKLAQALIESNRRGTSNYLDNLVRSLRHEARVVNDLLYPIYGQRPGRLARMVNPQGEHQAVLLGQPFVMQGDGKQAKPMPAQQGAEGAKTYQLTKDADWNVAVKVSKSYDTRREQEAATLGEIIAADPAQMQIIGDLYFKYQDGPGHEEMSERYKAMLAPPVAALVNGQEGTQQLQSQIAQMQQQMGELQQLADKNQTDLQKAQMQSASDREIERMKNATQIAVAKINALTKGVIVDQEAEDEAIALGLQHAHEATQAAMDREHQAGMSAQQQAGQAQLADQQHQQGLEAGDVAHQQGLESQAQQAALQPAPSEGA